MIVFVLSVYTLLWQCDGTSEIKKDPTRAPVTPKVTFGDKFYTTSVWPWYESGLFTGGFRLGARTETDAFPVEQVGSDGVWRPVCDDSWNDVTATAMCRMYGVYHGRRTSVETEGDYALGTVHCYHTYSMLTSEDWLYSLEDCVTESYVGRESERLPCSRNQGAAVYCWGMDPWWHEYYDITLLTGYTFFKFEFQARWVKMGTYYHMLDEDTLDPPPKARHFSATACGVPVKMTLEISKKRFHLSGDFAVDCEECFDIYIRDDILFDKVCKRSAANEHLTRHDTLPDDYTSPRYADVFGFFENQLPYLMDE